MDVVGNRYRIGRAIGEGGMGVVYEAIDQHTGQAVAIKRLRAIDIADATAVERFRREALATSQLRHPNIVQFLDYVNDVSPAIVLELLRGESLRQAMARHSPLPFDLTVRVVDDMLAGLDAAHRVGIVHRDIKPANVFLVAGAAGPQVKLLDFGIAKLLEQAGPALTRASNVVGTATYMSPEQIRGAGIDARSDLYAVGLCMYEMLTGKKPYDGGSMHQAMLRIMQGEPVPPHPALTPALLDFLRRVTHADVNARPASALDMKRAFHDATYASSTAQHRFDPHGHATQPTAPVWNAAPLAAPMQNAPYPLPPMLHVSTAGAPARHGSFFAGVAVMGAVGIALAIGAVVWLRAESSAPVLATPTASTALASTGPTPAASASVVPAESQAAKPTAAASAQRKTAPTPSANPNPAPGPAPNPTPSAKPPAVVAHLVVVLPPAQAQSQAALRAFVSPISKCFKIPGDSINFELEHAVTGQVTKRVAYSTAAEDPTIKCALPLIDGLVGRLPAGYAPGTVTRVRYKFSTDPFGF